MLSGVASSAVQFQLIWSLSIATLLGSLLGFDRALAGKHAGMRTYALVALGSCLFTILSTLAAQMFSSFVAVNPLQIASSIIVGIGFIGTGLAVFRGEHPVELTTASGLWVVAGIGMACGFKLYVLAVATTLIALIVFSLFAKVEHQLRENLMPESTAASHKKNSR